MNVGSRRREESRITQLYKVDAALFNGASMLSMAPGT